MISPFSVIPSEQQLEQVARGGLGKLESFIQDFEGSKTKEKDEKVKKIKGNIDQTLETIKKSEEELEQSLETLKKRTITSVGKFVNWARNKILISWILNIFNCFKVELEEQKKLILSIDSTRKNLNTMYAKNGDYESEIHAINSDYENTLECLKERSNTVINRAKAQDAIYNKIFGGRENFEKLPVLDLSIFPGANAFNWFTFLNADNLSAPIMRGIDPGGKVFFIIKLEEKNDKTEKKCKIQAFYEVSKTGVWSSTVKQNSLSIIPDIKGFWCEQEKIDETFLKTLIVVVNEFRVS